MKNKINVVVSVIVSMSNTILSMGIVGGCEYEYKHAGKGVVFCQSFGTNLYMPRKIN